MLACYNCLSNDLSHLILIIGFIYAFVGLHDLSSVFFAVVSCVCLLLAAQYMKFP